MTDMHEQPATGPTRRPTDSSEYDLWFDGLLDDAAARREHARVAADPEQRARFEADRAIEASLRRSFGAQDAAQPLPVWRTLSSPLARPIAPRVRYAAAGVVLALFGAALAISLTQRDSTSSTPPIAGNPTRPNDGAIATTPLAATATTPRPAPRLRTAQDSLGDVFLDALALDFQPLLGCQAKDPWDAELFAQLADAPCNRDEGVVVLGEWVDPRMDVANMLMLRRGENPIMLVVPRCEQETDLCVPKDSGLYVHRGMRDGRPIYEISPLPGSEILGCVAAQNVVTQQQF